MNKQQISFKQLMNAKIYKIPWICMLKLKRVVKNNNHHVKIK